MLIKPLIFAALAVSAAAPSGVPTAMAEESLPLVIKLKASSTFLPYRDNLPAIPKQCDSDGNPYVWLFGNNGMEIVGFTDSKLITLARWQVTDIPDPQFANFTIDSGSVYVLVNALENAKEEKVPYTDERTGKEAAWTRKTGERLQYIARFDRDGQYRGSTKLDHQLRVMQLGVFPSGTFAVAGVDETKTPRVALLSSSGVLIKFLDLGKDITDKPKSATSSFSTAIGADASPDVIAMFAQFYRSGDKLLLVRSITTTPVFEIRDSGEVHAIRVQALPGHAVDHMIPSDGNWLIDFGAAATKGISQREHVLYEVTSDTGERLHTYRVAADHERAYLSCRHGGNFSAIEQRDGRLTLLRGSAEAPPNDTEKGNGALPPQ